jgi:hypothetical protein
VNFILNSHKTDVRPSCLRWTKGELRLKRPQRFSDATRRSRDIEQRAIEKRQDMKEKRRPYVLPKCTHLEANLGSQLEVTCGESLASSNMRKKKVTRQPPKYA